MQRGEIVTIAAPGNYSGKPRPALVVQSNYFDQTLSLVVCPISSTIHENIGQFRITILPTHQNGLRVESQIAVDKIMSIPKAKIGYIIGHADEDLMVRVNRALAVFLAIA